MTFQTMESDTIITNRVTNEELIISRPGHQETIALTHKTLRLGRASDNDVVINSPVISRYHATISWENDHYQIIDGQIRQGQRQASGNGLHIEGERIIKHTLKNGDIVRIPDQQDNFITLMYFDGAAPPDSFTGQIELVKEITIGRDPRNDLVLADPLVSSFHAIVVPTGMGHAIRDLKSNSGTYLNGQRVQQANLQASDVMQFGSTQLHYDGRMIVVADLRREGIRLEAINLHKEVPVKKEVPTDSGIKILIDHVSLVIQPREFVAVVGGSGAGKSTILDALNGFRPSEGNVLLNGDDLYQNFDAYRQTIGYVPQEDIIHRELTVEEALYYAALLRLPADTQPAEINQRIDKALDLVAMTSRRKLIISQLSGGQRKRVSIAVELIADPGIIFLDEPTSGLDPGLDQKMMFTLQEIAKSGKTVILVTHATGNITACDLVAFFAAGGRLTFFGAPRDALTFFGVNDFAEIYHLVENESERWIEAFRKSSYYHNAITKRLGQAMPPTSDKSGNIKKSRPSIWQNIATSTRQWRILTQRYVKLLLRDRRNLLALLLQSPLIAALLYMVIDAGIFGKGVETTAADVTNAQKILFILACVGTWFGLINSVREIVKELPIYRRERLVNLSIGAYVGSKLGVMLLLGTIQSFLLVAIVGLRAGFSWEGDTYLTGPVEVFVTISMLTFTSACFGLFLSAVLGREDRVMSVMPLFLIPQIVFAGIVFNLDGPAKYISYFVFSRWGIEALGSTVNLLEMKKNASFSGPLTELPFTFTHSSFYLLQNWLILCGFILVSIMLTIISLRRLDVNR